MGHAQGISVVKPLLLAILISAWLPNALARSEGECLRFFEGKGLTSYRQAATRFIKVMDRRSVELTGWYLNIALPAAVNVADQRVDRVAVSFDAIAPSRIEYLKNSLVDSSFISEKSDHSAGFYLARDFGSLKINRSALRSDYGLSLLIVDMAAHPEVYNAISFPVEEALTEVSPLALEFYRALKGISLYEDGIEIPYHLAFDIQLAETLQDAVRVAVRYLRDAPLTAKKKFELWQALSKQFSLRFDCPHSNFDATPAYAIDSHGSKSYVSYGVGGFVLEFKPDGRLFKGQMTELHEVFPGDRVHLNYRWVKEVTAEY